MAIVLTPFREVISRVFEKGANVLVIITRSLKEMVTLKAIEGSKNELMMSIDLPQSNKSVVC